MIHAYAVEPEVAVSWTDRRAFRAICDRFGVGTPRAFLEFPKFSKWKRSVHQAAVAADLDEVDSMRLDELFQLFDQARVRRPGTTYDGERTWLENAEVEYSRHPFAAIIAMANPRSRSEVLLESAVGESTNQLWHRESAATPPRRADDLAKAVRAMLQNCRQLHLIDPHFNTGNPRHQRVLEAFMHVICSGPHGTSVKVVVHCEQKSSLLHFEDEAAKLAPRIAAGARIQFRRLVRRAGGEKLHNRYLLTDLGGVVFGTGLDDGKENETEDINLMSARQYDRRWQQYVAGNEFKEADTPAPIVGSRTARGRR